MKTTFIYTISDENNIIRYIGKSNNPFRRIHQHIKEGKNTHKYNWLQSIKKRGYFPVVEILDEVPIDDWEIYEMYWISQFKSWGFNLVNKCDGGIGPKGKKLSDEVKLHLSKIQKGKKLTEEHKSSIANGVKSYAKNNPNYNKCKDKNYIIDKEELYQKYIVENLSINECVKYFNIPQTTICRNLKEYKIKKDKSIWIKQCANNTSRNIIKNIVLKYDLDFNLIGEFLGLKEAAKSVNKNDISGISECCNGKSITAHNFIWRYKNEEITLDINKVKNRYSYHAKPVYQYNKQGLFIREYNSITEAAIENNLTRSAISSCCNGRSKSCNGYIWNYYKL